MGKKKTSGTSHTTTRVRCKCQHEQQDAMYGKGIRIANRTMKGDAGRGYDYRCTVCSAIHTV